MSVAPELAPEVHIPLRARRLARRETVHGRLALVPASWSAGERLAPAVTRPATVPVTTPVIMPLAVPARTDWSSARVVVAAAPIVAVRPGRARVGGAARTGRLTGRGRVVLAAAVICLAGLLAGLAALSAPAGSAAAAGPAPRVVTVRAGDTLWSIASRVAPGVDPRDEVARLRQLNHLPGVILQPGERLRTR